MKLLEIAEYSELLELIAKSEINWEKLNNKTFMITGATGLIGSFLIDVLMWKNKNQNFNFYIKALGRNPKKANDRFYDYINDKHFKFYKINLEDLSDFKESADYIFHFASSTHPLQYSKYPIETITANVIGTYNLLKLAKEVNCERFIFASSVEIYGENKNDIDFFDELYCGYINSNTLRAGYPESKRLAESLCQAFIAQSHMDIVIPRLARTFGPTMLMDDSKALSQFLKNGVNHKDIVLKSEGNQFYSYTFVADAVLGILYCLLYGTCGEAYNIANPEANITLKELAKTISHICKTNVVFELPNEVEKKGFSTATKAVMSNDKIYSLGFEAKFDLESSVKLTIKILNQLLYN